MDGDWKKMRLQVTVLQAAARRIGKKVKQHLIAMICPCQQESATTKAGEGLLRHGSGKTGADCCIKGVTAVL